MLLNSPITITVLETDQGLRLDHFLKNHFPDESRQKVQQWLENGAITRASQIPGQSTSLNASYKVKTGDQFNAIIPEPIDTHIVGQDIALTIVYEDDDVLVINKAAGMVVHPAPGHHDSTLVNALLGYCKESLSGIGGIIRPGIVHRLDKDTSGLMVVAKHDKAHIGLSEQFNPEGSAKKTLNRGYKALVFGSPPQREMILTGFIGRSRHNRQKMALLPHGGGKNIITHIKNDKTWYLTNGQLILSLLDCRLETGRTHQIRVHCQSIQCPLVGDPVYGKPQNHRKKSLPEEVANFKRQALHAYTLSFLHPMTGEPCTFHAPLPDDMQLAIDALNSQTINP